MKIPKFVRNNKSPYSNGGHVGYLKYFFNDLLFDRDIPKEYEKFMRNLVYHMYLKNENFEHTDLKTFLNNPPNKAELSDNGFQNKDKFYKMLSNSRVLDFFNDRLDYLIELPEPPKSFTKDEYEIMQQIQDSAYFIPVVYDSDWIPYSIENKYELIGYLLGHQWEYYATQTLYMREDVESLVIMLENPIMEHYKELELFLSNPMKDSKYKDEKIIKNFITEKPTVYSL